jgi:hypothetical protein
MDIAGLLSPPNYMHSDDFPDFSAAPEPESVLVNNEEESSVTVSELYCT